MPQILVVDDSKLMRHMIVACLRDIPGVTFIAACSGLEAIERLALDSFELMLLDLNMPDIGGIEVLEFVRGLDRLRSLPVVVVTTRDDDVSRSRAFAAGASRFVTKPFTPDTLQREVLALLDPASPP